VVTTVLTKPSRRAAVRQPAHEAVGLGGSAADRGGGQQELADQRAPRRQAGGRERPQPLARGLVVASVERDLGEQQLAAGGGQPAGQLGGRAKVAE
jgi:hypothetical protein